MEGEPEFIQATHLIALMEPSFRFQKDNSFDCMFPIRKTQNYTMPYHYLCDELIVEIFTRLPTKSLLRFRSLSKSWYSCIGSPDFICMHTFRFRQKQLLIRHRAYKENEEDEYEGFYTLHPEDQLPLCPTQGYIGIKPVEFPCTYSIIVGSCNGIVCLFYYNENHISLWNPSIRRKLTVPDCPWRCYSVKEIAFGYDSVTEDYKIVCIPGSNIGNVESSFVYAMKIGTWCTIASPMPLFVSVITKACFIKGALYWLVQSDCIYRCWLLTFDLSTHVFGSIASPEPHPERTIATTTFQGSLAVICDKRSDYWIWVRRDASWSVVFELKKIIDTGGLWNVLQLSTTGDLVFDTCNFGFEVYNPKIGTRTRPVEFNAAFFLLDIVQCVESLQLLDTGNACKGNKLSFS